MRSAIFLMLLAPTLVDHKSLTLDEGGK